MSNYIYNFFIYCSLFVVKELGQFRHSSSGNGHSGILKLTNKKTIPGKFLIARYPTFAILVSIRKVIRSDRNKRNTRATYHLLYI